MPPKSFLELMQWGPQGWLDEMTFATGLTLAVAIAGFLFGPVLPAGADPQICGGALRALETVEPWKAEGIESALRVFVEETGQKPRQAFAPVRLAVTGSNVSPPLPESLELLGRERTVSRIRAAAR